MHSSYRLNLQAGLTCLAINLAVTKQKCYAFARSVTHLLRIVGGKNVMIPGSVTHCYAVTHFLSLP